MCKIAFVNKIASFFPALKNELRVAHLPYTPVQYVNKNLKTTFLYSLLFTALFFFVLKKAGLSVFFLLPAFITLFILLFEYALLNVKAKIRKREREINREVLFVGRYLLVKLYSGRPLLNALMETSESRGIASKYIKEIVDDIGTGSTIEDALNSAMIYSPSEKLRKILFHINNSLQLGINVTGPLEAVLEEITREESIEIKKYGKKLNTLVIFYMLAAIILPSLGVALFIIVSSFVNLPIGLGSLLMFVFFIVVLQFIFITLFKSIRPMVNL
ncbi:type II secretion system F family protein [Candidatus Woesearchaeota archaeon]|nr:type II secretion system F family protein [Candidatus Woesearchaeota archaeon]